MWWRAYTLSFICGLAAFGCSAEDPAPKDTNSASGGRTSGDGGVTSGGMSNPQRGGTGNGPHAQGGSGGVGSAPGGNASGEPCAPGSSCLYYRESFDAGCAVGWTLRDGWRCGEPDGVVTPKPARSGSNVLVSTGVDAPVPFAWTATSPLIDLSRAGQPLLEFYAWLDTASQEQDFRVRARVGEKAFELTRVDPPYMGKGAWSGPFSAAGYARYRVDLSDFSGMVIALEFEFSGQSAGATKYVQIDDVSVFDASALPASLDSPALPRCRGPASRCAGRLAQTCSPSGTWQTSEECPFACVEGGRCGGECRPYESWCVEDRADLLAICDGSGLFQLTRTCLAGCEEGQCRGVYFDESFEGESLPGWSLSGDWLVSGEDPIRLFNPFEGRRVLGTKITSYYSDDQEYAENFAQTPRIDLTAATAPVLDFFGFIDTEQAHDGVNVWVRSDDQVDFELLTPEYPAYDTPVKGVPAWTGHPQTNFFRYRADLARFAGHGILLRFALASDGERASSGAYIDEVFVRERSLSPLAIELRSEPFYAFADVQFSQRLRAAGGSERVTWTIVQQQNADWLTIDPATGELSGVPGESDIGSAYALVRVEENEMPLNFSEMAYVLEVRRPRYATDFELNCAQDWTLDGDWQCGTPANVGPATVASGVACLGTVLDGDYRPQLESHAISPLIDVSDLKAPRLDFKLWLSSESMKDVLSLRVSSNGGEFVSVLDFSGSWATRGWLDVDRVDLSQYAGTKLRLDFTFKSDEVNQMPGAYVDTVVVSDGVDVAAAP